MLDEPDRNILLSVAEDSIRHGLEQGRPLPVTAADYPEALRPQRATFVTLERSGELRGCIGSLEAVRPLVEDVAHNAFAAAFSDPRFPPLATSERADLEVSISVLSPPEPMAFESEADLVRQLRPGVDGLILEEKGRRGTFLPAVWSSLPQPHRFFEQLKLKAGLPPDYWSPTVQAARYTTESFARPFRTG
ncbi:MAG TPA: AmmeMemoRadiSam system protein A [Gammaproteobacteria bacterium]|nr:AmmeMemoRadiSam system protein A [Gammaproteobacteria bacterium]